MRIKQRLKALTSVHEALTALTGSRAVHCKAQEPSASHLQGDHTSGLPSTAVLGNLTFMFVFILVHAHVDALLHLQDFKEVPSSQESYHSRYHCRL